MDLGFAVWVGVSRCPRLTLAGKGKAKGPPLKGKTLAPKSKAPSWFDFASDSELETAESLGFMVQVAA